MNPYNRPLETFKHNTSDTFVHVQFQQHGYEFLLSKGLFDQYYFRFIPHNDGNKLISIHDDSHLFVEDAHFNSIIQVLSSLPSMQNYKIEDIITACDYSHVDTFNNLNTQNIVCNIASSPYMNSTDMSDPTDWYYYALFPSDEAYDHIPKREIYRRIGSLIFKYDSPNNTQGMTYGVYYQRPDGMVTICDDSMINVELPYPLYGNLINVIKVDEQDRCINQEEYQKYCKLANRMPLPQHQYRKPI